MRYHGIWIVLTPLIAFAAAAGLAVGIGILLLWIAHIVPDHSTAKLINVGVALAIGLALSGAFAVWAARTR